MVVHIGFDVKEDPWLLEHSAKQLFSHVLTRS